MARYPRHGLEADSSAKLPALNVSDRGHAQSPQTQETQGTSESQAHCHVAATSKMTETGTKAQVLRRQTCSSSDQGSLCVSYWNVQEGCVLTWSFVLLS